MRAIAERMAERRLLPFIDKRVILARIAKKVERAAEKLGDVPAQDTVFAARCGERVYYDYGAKRKEWVN